MHRPRISVIIPAYNEEKRIAGAIGSVDRQHFAGKEVIVVDNGCTDRTAEIARRHARVVREPRKGISQARNAGARAARGDILFFMDADARMCGGALGAVDRAFRDMSVAIATGPILPLERRPTRSASVIFKFSFNMLVKASIALHRPYFVGADIVVRRSAFDAVHGFDERLKGCEDGNISKRAARVGRAVFDHRIAVRMSTRRIDAWGPGRYMVSTGAMVFKYLVSGRVAEGYWDDSIA